MYFEHEIFFDQTPFFDCEEGWIKLALITKMHFPQAI